MEMSSAALSLKKSIGSAASASRRASNKRKSNTREPMAAAMTNSAIKRLAHRAGIKNISADFYQETRGLCQLLLADLVGKITTFVEHQQRKTVTPADVVHAADRMKIKKVHFHDQLESHCKPPPPASKAKGRQASRGETALKNIRYEQLLSGCMYFQRAPFERMIKQMAEERAVDGLRWSPVAVDRVQVMVEGHLVHLFGLAGVCAIHGNRVTVANKDLQLVDRIFQEVPCIQVS